MDEISVNWSQKRYNEISKELNVYLKKVGYDLSKISIIPISGWNGDNIMERSPNLQWYKGPTLLEALDDIIPPKRLVDKPLRLPIQGVFRIAGIGIVLVGRVQTGHIKPGITVQFAPSGITTEVISIEKHHQKLTEAHAGDIIGFNVKNVSVKDIKFGFIASNAKDTPAKECVNFTAHVIVINH